MVAWVLLALAVSEGIAAWVLWRGLISTRVQSTRKRLDDLEERGDYLQHQIRRLRGHLTGGIRYEDEDEDDVADSPEGFPEGRFRQLLEERKHHGTG